MVLFSGILLTSLLVVVTIVAISWMAGALYYDVAGGGKWAKWPAMGWVVFSATAFIVWQPAWKPAVSLLVVFTLFVVWWLSQRPSNERQWEANSAVLAKVHRDGNLITIENVRNTEYRTRYDYSPNYDTRTYNLDHLHRVDLLLFYWGSPWMSHPILVFDFGRDGRVCISIEVRYRLGQKYNLLRSRKRYPLFLPFRRLAKQVVVLTE